MRPCLALMAALAAAGAPGCSRGALSRPEAARLIGVHARFAQVEESIELDDAAWQRGQVLGLWRLRSVMPPAVDVTRPARTHFRDVAVLPFGGGWVRPAQAPRRAVVEVTGIATQSGSTCGAEFTWRYDGLPSWAAPVEDGRAATGRAAFRLYDDGWRIESVQAHGGRLRVVAAALPVVERSAETPERRGVSLDAHCRRHGFQAARNRDGTGYGWVCDPGAAPLEIESACQEQHGPSFHARLTSSPPGGAGDWICVGG